MIRIEVQSDNYYVHIKCEIERNLTDDSWHLTYCIPCEPNTTLIGIAIDFSRCNIECEDGHGIQKQIYTFPPPTILGKCVLIHRECKIIKSTVKLKNDQ